MLDRQDEDADTADVRALAPLRRANEAGGLLPDPAAGGIAAFPRLTQGDLETPVAASSWPPWPDRPAKLLELLWDAPPAGTPALDAVGDRLLARLPPAEQVTLEVSSFLAENALSQLALVDVPGLPAVSRNAAEEGRHPMVTPATAVTLVHAVRRPLRAPSVPLSQQARSPGETAMILNPERSLLGIDPKSTGQLELTASWRERRDDESHDVTGRPVQTVIVDRGDKTLRETLRHEFGDTRHRMVDYTVTAVSRFRQYFGDEPATAFRATPPAPLRINVRSSARPAPPAVESAMPALVWSEIRNPGIVERRRLGGQLLIELARPWHQTGDGELLALICWTSQTSDPSHPREPEARLQRCSPRSRATPSA
jgi:hypothetical protein